MGQINKKDAETLRRYLETGLVGNTTSPTDWGSALTRQLLRLLDIRDAHADRPDQCDAEAFEAAIPTCCPGDECREGYHAAQSAL